nr:ThiF family adenylyltransferase [Streptomyces sp. Alain-F2R5]
MARLHVGVVGCGSVGMLVVEALARTGIQRLSLFDFDTVEELNLDRLLHATLHDVRLHRAKAFVFYSSAAAAQLNQFVTMTIAPGGIADTGAHLYHLTTGTVDRREDGCKAGCLYDGPLRALGDDTPVTVTGRYPAAEQACTARARVVRSWPLRARHAVDGLLQRLS